MNAQQQIVAYWQFCEQQGLRPSIRSCVAHLRMNKVRIDERKAAAYLVGFASQSPHPKATRQKLVENSSTSPAQAQHKPSTSPAQAQHDSSTPAERFQHKPSTDSAHGQHKPSTDSAHGQHYTRAVKVSLVSKNISPANAEETAATAENAATTRPKRVVVTVPPVSFGDDEQLVGLLLAQMASRNRDGKMLESRVARERAALKAILDAYGRAAFLHAASVTLGKSDLRGRCTAFVAAVAKNYQAQPSLPIAPARRDFYAPPDPVLEPWRIQNVPIR